MKVRARAAVSAVIRHLDSITGSGPSGFQKRRWRPASSSSCETNPPNASVHWVRPRSVASTRACELRWQSQSFRLWGGGD